MFKILKKSFLLDILIFLGLFITLLPLVSQINFYQNDDYVYYSMTENFMRGVFELDSYTSASFYTQGLMGALFAHIFGVSRLPILTMILSVLNFVIIKNILSKFLKFKSVSSYLIASFYFLNPLVFYSSLGYMTETYFMFFFLLSVYFYLDFLQKDKVVSLGISNLFILVGFFLRQLSFVTSVAIFLDLLFRKKFKLATLQALFTGILLLIQYFVFPKTPVMYETSLEFKNLLDLNYLVFYFWSSGIFISMTLFPLIFFLLKSKDIKELFKIVVTAVILMILLNFTFNKIAFGSGEFPYLGNVVEQKGFYSKDIYGLKYHFPGIFKLYQGWEFISQVGFCIFLAVVGWRLKKFVNFFSLYLVCFFGLFLITPVVYDRYLISMIAIGVLAIGAGISKETFEIPALKPLLIPFMLFLAFYIYQFSNEFVQIQKYVWNKGIELMSQYQIEGRQIDSTNAWKRTYGFTRGELRFLYTFDEKYKLKFPVKDVALLERHEIKFPFNFFLDPYVYLFVVK